jgi:hypothetical protein
VNLLIKLIILKYAGEFRPTLAMPSIWSKREIMCRSVTDRYHNWCNCLFRVPRRFFASAKSTFSEAILSADSLNNRKIWKKIINNDNWVWAPTLFLSNPKKVKQVIIFYEVMNKSSPRSCDEIITIHNFRSLLPWLTILNSFSVNHLHHFLPRSTKSGFYIIKGRI